MEDSFRVRVDKVFGSLASSSSSSSSPSLSSLWCLTDEEVERREWNREKDSPDTEPTPYPPNLDGFFVNQQKMPEKNSVDVPKELEADLQDLNDDEQHPRGSFDKSVLKPDDHDDEEWNIRSSIGLDCTLDYEKEEDGYDKVALGREKAGDRLYMSDIKDYGIYLDSFNELPNSLKDVTRDPRANHLAAKMRLKEDAEAAGNFGSLRVSDKILPAAVDTQINTSEDGVNLKSILKRKENHMDSKSQKRVRFDPGCKNDREEESEGAKDFAMETCSMEEATVLDEVSFLPQDPSRVPDYIRNPSKYTHYTFDSLSEIDEESNRQAYMDFLNLLKRANTMESQPDDTSTDLPKSVTFTPKKKTGDATMVKNSTEFKQNLEDVGKEFMRRKGLPIGIAAEDAQESEVCAMEEDEPESSADKSNSSRRPGRQYRMKARSELDESIT